MKQPLRILNERSGFFGLLVVDLAVLGWLLIFSHALLEKIQLGYLALLIAGFNAVVLIAVRLRYRRKIIRDTFRLIFTGKFR